jgi:nitroreductase
MANERIPDFSIDPLFLRRWSSRAMSGEALSQGELMTLFEAARWAPSSSNEQPWRFVYALRGTRYWEKFFALLDSGNQEWCKNASVLVITLSKKTDEDGEPNDTHSFDTGAAWENLALQGSISGLVVHGLGGFNYKKARALLKLDDTFTVEMMIAIGKKGKLEDLPERFRSRESPNDRKRLKEFVFEGKIS